MTTTVEGRLLTNKQAADYLGIRENTLPVWRCRNSPSIAFFKVGSLVKYRIEDLDTYLAAQRVDRSGN